MKKILLLVLFSASLFTNIMFAQIGKDICNCGEKSMDISTGYNNGPKTLIPNGQPDNEWRIIANPTSPTPNYSTGVNPIVANPPHGLWAAATSRAKWLTPPANIDLKIGDYQYQYLFTVPAGYTAKVKISRIGGDDDVELFVDYSKVYSKTGGWAFSEKFVQQQKCIEIGGLTADPHTITIKVKNTGQGSTGAYLEGCYELIPCHCPKGWLSNTTNQDGGVTTDGRCKKLVCGPIAVIPPPDGTQLGNWGFTWGNTLWAYGTKENGGAVICDDKDTNNTCPQGYTFQNGKCVPVIQQILIWWKTGHRCTKGGLYCYGKSDVKIDLEGYAKNLEKDATISESTIQIVDADNILITSISKAGSVSKETMDMFLNRKVELPDVEIPSDYYKDLFNGVSLKIPQQNIYFKSAEQRYTVNITTFNGNAVQIIEAYQKTRINIDGKDYNLTIITTSGQGIRSPATTIFEK